MTDPTRTPTPWALPAEWLRSWRAARRARAASTVPRTPRRPVSLDELIASGLVELLDVAPVVHVVEPDELAILRDLRAAVAAADADRLAAALDSPAGAGESVEAFRG